MIIVVAIIGIITLIGFPKIRQTLDKTNLRSARAAVGTMAGTARAAAIQRGCRSALHFAAATHAVGVTTACPTKVAPVSGGPGSKARVTRMIGRGQRSAVAAQYAQRRLEMLRVTGCKSQAGGSEVMMRGSTPVDSLTWRFATTGANHWQIVVRSKYPTARGQWRTDSTETQISCLF